MQKNEYLDMRILELVYKCIQFMQLFEWIGQIYHQNIQVVLYKDAGDVDEDGGRLHFGRLR